MSEITTSERRHSFIAKIVCLLLALILWIYVMEMENPDWEITVEGIPVVLAGTDEIRIDNDLTIYSGYQTTIDLTLRGRRRDVEGITADDIKIEADVTKITEVGEYQLPITVTVPSDTEIIDRSANNVTVRVDKNDQKTIRVQPRFIGVSTGHEYSLGDPVLSVQEITVTGPSRYLSEIDHAEAIISDLGRITSSQNVRCQLTLIDGNGGEITNQYISMSNTEVTVQVPLYMTKEVPLAVDFAKEYYKSDYVKVDIRPESIEIKGEVSVVEAVDSIIVATISDNEMLGDIGFDAHFTLPDGVECPDGIENAAVTVKHERTETREVVVNFGNMNVINPNGVNYQVTQQSITITVRGTPEELDNISWHDITPEIDLSAYTGDQTLTVTPPVRFTFNSKNTVYEIGNYSVDVSISGTSAGE